MPPLYLDYNATTPLDPRVLEAMLPWLAGPANSGSRTHLFGQQAKAAVERAREQVAQILGARPEEILFTSGATESNNLAILGLVSLGERTGRKHVLSTAIEHKAVLEPLARLGGMGFEVELVPVTRGGYVEPREIERRLRGDTLLVSVMHANNETGVLQPIEEVARLLADRPALLHTDAAQTFGKEVDALRRAGCDLVSVSAHKIYGPQGIGALRVAARKLDRRELRALAVGGGQERGLRPGTVPVALAVGLGEAAALAGAEHAERRMAAAEVKAAFLAGLEDVEYRVHGDPARTQAHVVNLSFPGVDSEALMVELRDDVAISNGSACTSSSYAPSHVLQAMGLDEGEMEWPLRISWGPRIDEIPVTLFLEALSAIA